MEGLQIKSTGQIREIQLGSGKNSISVGGQNCLNFHHFEGDLPRAPSISHEIWDVPPDNWPEVAKEPFAGVIEDPVRWAKKCTDEYGAKLLTVYLASTDPNGLNKPSEDSAALAAKLADEIDIPLIFWGCDNNAKDAITLKLIAEACEGKNVCIGPCTDKNYKQIGAAAIAYKHNVIASTPIDVNLAKQLNILLLELGVPENNIIMDPTTGGLGYGIEYTYSVMERDRIAALQQEDEKLAFPMICFASREIWKTKEAAMSESDYPEMGNQKNRGIMTEAITANLLAMAGADIIVARHPEAIKIITEYFGEYRLK